MKKQYTVVLGITCLISVALSGNTLLAGSCDTAGMYSEGPSSGCQKPSDPVKLGKDYFAKDNAEIMAEGPPNLNSQFPQDTPKLLLATAKDSIDVENTWTEGIPYHSSSQGVTTIAQHKSKALQTQPAAGK